MFKSFSALALCLFAAIGAQAQSTPGEASRAAVYGEQVRGSGAVASRGEAAVEGVACGGVGQPVCAKAADGGETERRVSAGGEPDAMALAWAALGVVVFVALRRRPR